MKRICFILLSAGLVISLHAQQTLKLSLEHTIQLANDSSLEAFRAQNMYLAGYWEYRTFRANRLPSLSLDLTPAQYYRDITRRYDYTANLDVYRKQQSLYASGELSLKQNLDLTGGTFYVDTRLDYMRSFGESTTNQFTSVPIRIGYSQSLVGFNSFKWEKKIEPLKYEKVKKQFIANVESVSERAVQLFFELALAQATYNLAKDNVVQSDTLYRIGEQRYQIAAIQQADLLTLQLDKVNAQIELQNSTGALNRTMSALASFLHIDKNTIIELELPDEPSTFSIQAEKALELSRANNPDHLQQQQNVLEAERNVDQRRKESYFNANINASIGFNQVSDRLADAYRNLLQQDLVSINLTIPLLDWGVRKGKYNMARNNLNIARITAEQSSIALDQDIIMTVSDFNVQQQLVSSAADALNLSKVAYQQVRERFIIGKTDISSLTLSLNRQQSAQKNYIAALQNYWAYYYKIRRLTLYDFEHNISLTEQFDLNGGYLIR